MKTRLLLAAAACALLTGPALGQQALPPPVFHHLMLNSVDPQKAIDYYSKGFINTHPTTWEGYPAVATDNHVLVLFNKVATPPDANTQTTAFWHFGWNATDERAKVKELLDKGYKFAPLWTGLGDGSVTISSDTLPGKGGIYGLGETKEQMAESIKNGVKPAGGAGFAYLAGPDNARIEVAGNNDQERFNHIHMWQDEPYCAQLWYQQHLNAPVRPPQPGQPSYTNTNCHVDRSVATWPGLEKEGMYRYPTAGVTFGDVSMNWYMDQTDKPLVGTLGHLMDSVGLAVPNLDPWIAKLKAENVKFLKEEYKYGNTRAIMIEGPSHEAIALVEVK